MPRLKGPDQPVAVWTASHRLASVPFQKASTSPVVGRSAMVGGEPNGPMPTRVGPVHADPSQNAPHRFESVPFQTTCWCPDESVVAAGAFALPGAWLLFSTSQETFG